MDYVIPPAEIPWVAVAGTDARFPVHRIYCVGRNYAAHAREMGADPEREPPFFFHKPADAVLASGARFPYPPASSEVHPEIELVVALAGGGAHIPVAAALDCVYGYAVGLDMTRRDLQRAAKQRGLPWEASKAFDHAAPCGPIRPAAEIGHPARGAIWLEVDGERRQEGDLAELIWPVPELIARLSGLVRLAPGDLIFTGTPAGVGPVERGQRLHGVVDEVGEIELEVA
ncbi:fumarylacetoacetate hydrolase family protein [Haliangium sp.]|uniref:fumarylacetoacetate hydrolase family protein n=1 Tax=Haliangium sp. TaxID=2663208 RepID=UPI003D10A35F